MPLSLAHMGAGIIGQQRREHRLRLHAEQTAVDGFKGQRHVVAVHHLHQGKPLRQHRSLRCRCLPLFVAGFGCSQGVVAVSHGKQHGMLFPAAQMRQGTGNLLHLGLRQSTAM